MNLLFETVNFWFHRCSFLLKFNENERMYQKTIDIT